MFVLRASSRRYRRHPRRSVAIGTTVLVTMLLAAGCGDAPPSEESRSSETGCARDSSVGARGASLLPVPPARVDMLDPGGPERAALVGTPDRSSAQRVRLSTTSAATPVGRGQAPDGSDRQTVDMTITSRVLCSDPTDVELQLDAVTSPTRTLANAVPSAAGTRAGLAVTSGAVPVSLRIVPAATADDTARAAVEQALLSTMQRSVALPRAPVGTGARWRAVRTLPGAATITQTVTATLRDRIGSRLVLDVDVDEEPLDSRFLLPDGQALTITAFSMSGRGTVTVDLTRGLPVDGSLTMQGGRTLVGADPARPLTQATSTALRWTTTPG